MIQPIGVGTRPGTTPVTETQAAIREAATQFEGLLLSQLLESAFSDQEEGLFGSGSGAHVYQGFLETYLAQHLAESGGLGLADRIAESLGGGGG